MYVWKKKSYDTVVMITRNMQSVQTETNCVHVPHWFRFLALFLILVLLFVPWIIHFAGFVRIAIFYIGVVSLNIVDVVI